MRHDIEDTEAVVSFEGWKRKNRKSPTCDHPRVWIDESKGTVECRDCEAIVSAFYFLKKMAHRENQFFIRLASMRREITELKAWKPWMKVAKKLESMWRGGKYLPCCPHCSWAIHYKEMENCSSRHVDYTEKSIR